MDGAALLLGSRIGGCPCLMPGNILVPRNLHTLSGFAASNVLLAFDYDGTLAPIASAPAAARMRAATRRWLTRVAQLYPCVVISGRPLDDLTRRLGRIPVWYLFGNHGLEPHAGSDEHATRVKKWVHQLTTQLPRQQGLVIEHKKYSVAVHYRGVRNRKRVLDSIADAVGQLSDVRTITGASAVNLLPAGGADKGVRSDEHATRVKKWVHQLTTQLPRQQGLVIEHKKYSVAVHYRGVRNRKRVLDSIADAVGQLSDVRTITGASAVNLLPAGGADKGV